MNPASRNLEFPWPILRVVVEGMSILDVPHLEVQTMEEATSFIQAYGFDTGDHVDNETLWSVYGEAVDFIEKSLTDPRYPKVPEHLRSRDSVKDLRRLLLLASKKEQDTDQLWACALLRMMHVLIHLKHDPRLKYFEQVQNQVLSRLDSHIYVDSATGTTFLGPQDPNGRIKLLFFKKKDRKDREREIIKLLHKAENLVEEIYDRIGFRLVTETKFDALRALRLLLQQNIISLPNIRPGRSRNRLIDVNRLKGEIARIMQALEKNPALTDAELGRFMQRLERRIGFRRLGRSLINPHSSEFFRSIQFTCRELVKVRNPIHQVYCALETQLKNLHGGEQLLKEVFDKAPPAADYVFFPYEIQIMDVKAYADSIFGRSNHEAYRRKQLEAARDRVFGRTLTD